MNRIAFFLFALWVFSACQREPMPCFETSKDLADVGENVTFINCSFSAKSYTWDFGDSTTSTEKNPVHAWNFPGTKIITLKAYSADGEKVGTFSFTVRVGRRTIQTVQVVSFPWLDSLGNPWDTTDAADLIFRVAPQDTVLNWKLETGEVTDAVAPWTWTFFAPRTPFDKYGIPWVWELVDHDDTTDVTMGSGTFFPYAAWTGNQISLQDDSVSVLLNYAVE